MFVSAFASSNCSVCGSAEQEVLGGADSHAGWLLLESFHFGNALYHNKSVLTSP